LRVKLESVARESHRSLNGEIVFRLERSLREEKRES
jgi:Arc-like DNA binding domain